ncbi:MAG: M24 family metallopeptidase [Planctomycetaceae bacterium]|nr:M24 family metallopeptidase [Planctomycetaceae bacterium]
MLSLGVNLAVLLVSAHLPATATPGPLEPGAQGGTQVPVAALTRPGDGRPVAGLGAAFHGGRRAALRELLGDGLVLVRGLPTPRGYVPFRQDKTFWYLTGIESPDAALLMDSKSGEEILFLPEANAALESWEGELWDVGDTWVKELTGFRDVRPASELLAVLDERLDAGSTIWISTYPEVVQAGAADRSRPFDAQRRGDPLDGRPARADALKEQLERRFGAKVADCRRQLEELRWVKQPAELDALRRASESAARAMVDAIRYTKPGMGEWEIAARMAYVHQLEGASGPAYLPIVGAGANSCILHYGAVGRRMQESEVLLVDYGPEVDGYISDVTRTWPVGKTFTARAAELYDIVLEAQLAGIAAVRAGATFATIETACNEVFQRQGVMKYRMHGVCHTVGLEVHDTNVRRGTLVEGSVFTVEPGLYDREAGIGIRIEDVVLVTADGVEVLSASVPKTRAEIEALRALPPIPR